MENAKMVRVRNVDVSVLSEKQVYELTEQIGKKLAEMVSEVTERANKILEIYGMESKMQLLIVQKSKTA